MSCLLVERHFDHAQNPRMSGAAPRSMELFRTLGLEDNIRALDEHPDPVILRVDTLAGREVERYQLGGDDDVRAISPAPEAWCDQDQLEPVIRERAEQLGADIRFGAELVEFNQADDEVRAVVRDRTTGSDYTLRASYLLACDGTHSPTRKHLGITRSGPGVLAHQVGALFRADLSGALRGRSFVLCLIDAVQGAGLHVRNLGRWGFGIPYHPEQGQRPEDITEDRFIELIRAAVGQPELAVEVLEISVWSLEAEVADTFRSGRMFLLGDAAHAMPPTGGFGGNSCIQDAHNLAWKLAMVLCGTAGAGLLDTYDAERRPVAQLGMQASVARAGLFLAGSAEGGSGQPHGHHDHANVALGYRYHSDAIMLEPDQDTSEPVEDPRRPTGRPGTRAPHVILQHAGQPISTLDLFGHGFVLLTGPNGQHWQQTAREAADQHHIALASYRIGPADAAPNLIDVHDTWADTYGITATGAVLIRPDGFIAWRRTATPDHPPRALHKVLPSLLDLRERASTPSNTDTTRRAHTRPQP